MAKIAFILLCHKDPDAIIQQAERLTAVGDYMAIHFDASARESDYQRIRKSLDANPNVTFAKKRIQCGWGEWSLVQATLQAMQAALDEFPRATHFYMLSGDCMAIKSSVYAHDLLDGNDVDFIESFDYFTSEWIKTGMKEDRLIYRHVFNERVQKRLFYWSYELQKRFGLRREIPKDLQMMIGSQWWCLRRRTVEAIMDFTNERRDVMRFFRTTWIPDETFFQTLTRHLIPGTEIQSRTLTFLMFTDYGMPVTFYNDHYDLLLSQDFLFARKVSEDAIELKERLGDLYASDRRDFQTSNEGRTLFKFLTGRGRIGRRFAPRFWERQANLAKRTRHRRGLMRLLYDDLGVDRMVICLDPSNLDLIQDLFSDTATTRLLEIECKYEDEYLLGHAMRVGLAGEMTPQDTIDRLLPTVRQNFEFETDQIRDADFQGAFRISENLSQSENTPALAAFLDVENAVADEVLSIDYLFED